MQRVLALAAEESLARLFDAQSALDCERQHRGREAPIVVGHAREVAHRGRRFALRCFVVRHDDAPGWVASDRVPGAPVIENQQDQPGRGEQRRPRIAEQVGCATPGARRRNVTLGPACDDGEALAGPEPARRAVRRDAGVDTGGPLAALRALRPRVGLHPDRVGGHCRGQRNRCADLVDRESPAVAGDVPV